MTTLAVIAGAACTVGLLLGVGLTFATTRRCACDDHVTQEDMERVAVATAGPFHPRHEIWRSQ